MTNTTTKINSQRNTSSCPYVQDLTLIGLLFDVRPHNRCIHRVFLRFDGQERRA